MGESRASTIAPSTRDLYLLRLDKHPLRILGLMTKAVDVTPAHLRTMIDKLRVGKASGSWMRGVVVATGQTTDRVARVTLSRSQAVDCHFLARKAAWLRPSASSVVARRRRWTTLGD